MNIVNRNCDHVVMVLVMIFLSSGFNSITANKKEEYGMLSFNKAINIASKQPMLSYKMTKSYLYLIKNPFDSNAKEDLWISKNIFERHNLILKENSDNYQTRLLIEESDKIWKKLKKLIESTPNHKYAEKIIDLNSNLMNITNNLISTMISKSTSANQKGIKLLEEADSNQRDVELKNMINIVGIQRTLSQKLALYYFINESILKSEDSERTMHNTIKIIDNGIVTLLLSDFNTSKIEEQLSIAIYKFENIKSYITTPEKDKSKMVNMYKISNELTHAFNEVILLYEGVKS